MKKHHNHNGSHSHSKARIASDRAARKLGGASASSAAVMRRDLKPGTKTANGVNQHFGSFAPASARA